jgi:serine/threonine protein kinase
MCSVQIGVKEVGRSEVGLVQDEIDRLTTPQYRAPEQCSVQSGAVLGTKARHPRPAPSLPRCRAHGTQIDVWALGVMLYQMAFKRTPWDSTLGTMGGRYRLPDRPRFSENFNVRPTSLLGLWRCVLIRRRRRSLRWCSNSSRTSDRRCPS